MAQSLYREWFVHFRFPGHEKKRLVESELGLIPEGWEVVRFTDIADVLSGGTPRTTTSEYWNGSIPFFTPKDASSSFYVTETEKSITRIGLKTCNSKLYPKNTVFITARGTVGKVVLSAVDMAMNQSCYALQGRDGIDQITIFFSISNCINQLKQNAHGAVFDTIIVDTFRMLQVVKPPLALTSAFEALASPIFEMILKLLNKNANLRQTRDLLLPKLISGEVDVEELDIHIEGGTYASSREPIPSTP
jgi:type I restriction enzyme S subunit